MKNRIFSLLLAVCAVLSLAVTATAMEVPEEGKGNCSIEVAVRYRGEPITDGKLTAVRVGYIDEDDGNYFFRHVFTHEEIQNVGSRETVDRILSAYTRQKDYVRFPETTADIHRGAARFSRLETGLYLIIQEEEDASTGFYPINAFLVSVPYWDGTEYRYHVTVDVKTALDRIHPLPAEKEEDKPSSGKLPQTGQLTWPVPVMACSGMLLFAAGWWLTFGDRKDSHEK